MEYNTRQTLIYRLKQDDHSAWEEFVKAYSKYIYVIIRSMNIRHHDAEDLQQTVFSKAMAGLPKFEYNPEKSRFRSWIIVITKNAVRNFKALKVNQIEQLDGSGCEDLQQYVSGIKDSDVEKQAEKEWQNYLVNMALENLKDNFQDHVLKTFMYILEGMTPIEVAHKMDQPLNTVHKYKKRVENALFREIKRLNYELS